MAVAAFRRGILIVFVGNAQALGVVDVSVDEFVRAWQVALL
jgi:hypothetical protein